MAAPLKLVLVILAALLFGLAAFGVGHPRYNLIAAGLCCVTVAYLIV
jgi:hypothetical protein